MGSIGLQDASWHLVYRVRCLMADKVFGTVPNRSRKISGLVLDSNRSEMSTIGDVYNNWGVVNVTVLLQGTERTPP